MITCVGSVFLDNIVSINSFPSKPIKLLATNLEKRLGGSAAVSSFTIKILGGESEYIGRFGDDDAGKFLKEEFKKFNINFHKSLTLQKTISSQSYIFEDKKGERLLAAFNAKKLLRNKLLIKFLFKKNQSYVVDIRWLDATHYIAKKTYDKKILCIADIDNYKKNKKIEEIIKYASHPIFSETGMYEFTKEKSVIKSLRKLYLKNNKFYGVTFGSKGVYWIEKGIIYNCFPPKIKVVETNCAGDIFHGAFAAFLHQKKSISTSMILATATASLKCKKKGGIYSIPSIKLVREFAKKIKVKKIKNL